MDIRDSGIGDVFKNESPEVLIHLAAQMDVRVSIKKPIFDSAVNIGGTVNLLENCVKYKVRKVIYSNTGGALYGEVDERDIPVKEEHPINPLSPYGIDKHTVEHYLYLYYKNYGLNYTSLRYSNVYGNRQNPLGEAGVIAIFIDKMMNDESPIIFGDGKQTRDYVYVKDIVRGNLLALTKGDNEAVNLGSGVRISVLDIFNELKDLMKFDKDPKFKSERMGEVKHIALNSDKAFDKLGWKTEFDFSEGIKRTLDYYKKSKMR